MASEYLASLRSVAPSFLHDLGCAGRLTSPTGKPAGVSEGQLYDALAPNYDRRHARWLKHAGGEAQAGIEGAVRALIGPDTNMLDVGCGTGVFVRRLVNEGLAPNQVTLLDASSRMLNHASDLPVTRLQASMGRLPFADASFDLVTCLWALETVTHRHSSIREIFRVLKPGGWACFAFCADERPYSIVGHLLRWAIERRRTGRFLRRDKVVTCLLAIGDVAIHQIPCRGPATALLCRRGDTGYC